MRFLDKAIHYSAERGYDWMSMHLECSVGWDGWVIQFFYNNNNKDYRNLSCDSCTWNNVFNTLSDDNNLQFDTNNHLLTGWNFEYVGKYAIFCSDSLVFEEPFQLGKS